MPSAKVKRAIKAFEEAVESRTSLDVDTPPTARFIIEHNYVKARAKLERLMENL